MFSEDTIAAISTLIGHGGIGIVRLSGDRAITIVAPLFRASSGKGLECLPSHRITHGFIVDPITGELLDEVLVSVMKAPFTYTREDVVEINCHGGPMPLKRVFELVIKSGARIAEAGEFTKRAFLNGRIDLTQAEAVCDLIQARTELGHKAAMEQLEGRLSKTIEALRDRIINLTAWVEAYIDFPEEDIEIATGEQLNTEATKIIRDIKYLLASAKEGKIIREGVKTAIVGRPNVGKSSLLNAFLGQDRAIVSEFPGTTRDVIEDSLNIQGVPFRILDTAGLRTSPNMVEIEGINRSFKAMNQADLILLVLDQSQPIHETETVILQSRKNLIVVLNKIDLPSKIDAQIIPSNLAKIPVSATQQKGLNNLKEAMVNHIFGHGIETSHLMVTNVRHIIALEKSISSLENFLHSLAQKTFPEFLSLELRDTLNALGEILGPTTPDDILNLIFRDFCIGK